MSDEKKTAAKDAKEKASDKSEKKACEKACLLEVGGCKSPLRVTEFGAQPLHNGSQILVDSKISRRLVEQYRPYLTLKEEQKAVKGLKKDYYEIVKSEGPKAADAKPEAGKTKADKSMAGKGSAK